LSQEKVLTVRYWGTRGSIPTPGRATVRYGGNTSCVEVLAGDTRIILDAGTGIRPLGENLQRNPDLRQTSIFLTHFHWDHVQGFPFFAPAYDPDFRLRIFGPTQDGVGLEELVRKQMGPISFPLPYESLGGNITFHPFNEGTRTEGQVTVHALRVRHACFTLGYRVEAFDRSVVFVPDNELKGAGFDVPSDWEDAFLSFVSGADLLVHDSTFTTREYDQKRGWGHSTFRQSGELAERAGVSALHFFHHSPGRSDDELEAIVRKHEEELAARGSKMRVGAAAEDREVRLGNEGFSGE
jgi:phosphoribosyl 1,2-cyclic phosphodiesterase